MTIQCPHCNHDLNLGTLLGRASRGSRKRFSPEAIAKLRANLARGREVLQARRAEEKSAQWTKISIASDTPIGVVSES